MSILSNYRASMQRIIKADDVETAFREEGFSEASTNLMLKNKSFKATRSIQRQDDSQAPAEQSDKMSQGQDD